MRVLSQRDLFERWAYEAFPLGRGGYLLDVNCRHLDFPLDVPATWALHNYLLYRPDPHTGGWTCYVGETQNRLERVREDSSRKKPPAMGRAMLLYACGHLPGSDFRRTLEARIYFALRRQRGVRFTNQPKGLAQLSGACLEAPYLERCLRGVWQGLQRTGVVAGCQGWMPPEDRFELQLPNHREAYFADAGIDGHGCWKVTAGSYALAAAGVPQDDHRALRASLVANGVLQPRGGSLFQFTRECIFDNPSMAAGVILGSNACGLQVWRQRGTGLLLRHCRLPEHLRGRWNR